MLKLTQNYLIIIRANIMLQKQTFLKKSIEIGSFFGVLLGWGIIILTRDNISSMFIVLTICMILLYLFLKMIILNYKCSKDYQ